MVRAMFTVIMSAAILAGGGVAYSTEPDNSYIGIGAREFATQKIGTCCFIDMKNLSVINTGTAKSAGYPDLSGQLAEANRTNADLARQLAASKAGQNPDLSGQNADLARQLAESKAAQNPDRAGEVAALTAANADLARQLAARTTKPAPYATLLEKEYFNTGSAELKPEGVKKLKQLSEDLKAKAGPDTEIRIEGHTDNVPIHNAMYPSNWELSSARATTVVRNLQANGINGERLLDIGYGSSRPTESNTSVESRGMNRRVEIILTPALSAPAQPKQ